MAIGMFQTAIPPLIRALGNLSHVLEKAAVHCEENKIDPSSLIQYRLFPDMFPLTFQVQVACDMSKGCAARLSGIEPPKFEDNEKTFDELRARIDRTLEFVKSIGREQIDGSEEKAIVLKTPRGELNFTGLNYVQGFVLPNVYFHSATTYNILRTNGVPLGKMDYIGQP